MEEIVLVVVGKVLAVLGLIAANGFFVASEFALVGVRRTRIDELVALSDGTAKLLQRAVVGLDDSLAATQLGVTVSSLALGWVGEPALADLLEPALGMLGRAALGSAHALATAGAFAVITVFHIVLGELVPKNIALQKPEPTALWIVRPLGLFLTLFRPGIALLNGLGGVVMRLLGLEHSSEGNRLHSTEELKLLVAASRSAGLVDQAQQDVVERAFAMGNRRVRSIMTPRHDVDWVDADGTTDAILRGVRHGRHEQIVMTKGTLDDVVGILRKQDLLDMHLDGKLPTEDSEDGRAALLRAVRAPLVVHDGASITQVLDMFKQRLVQMGLVYDEYGSLRGVVTQADLLEALAGEIVDTDDDMSVVVREDGSYVADGARPFQDVFAQVGIAPPPSEASEYRTLAGFVLSKLGRIPVSGDSVECEVGGSEWCFAVTRMEGRRIDEVSMRRTAD
ncbi:HlyC/CorC family transporter [Lichenibacterium minor]|uniref:HlyC/CorC family transporter n=1 Tax=Lichenibacterium minor TaxID=2316528 RepID=A0A4Q2TZE7_9HYPH|nr:hemolysin family protein [Lichenibacterium minor]RYC29452.1 HlyC/CorC family transporter [Lichenibacterium minor]